MATLWEDLINERPRASDAAGWEVCFKLINAMGVTLLIGTPLRLATLRWVEPPLKHPLQLAQLICRLLGSVSRGGRTPRDASLP